MLKLTTFPTKSLSTINMHQMGLSSLTFHRIRCWAKLDPTRIPLKPWTEGKTSGTFDPPQASQFLTPYLPPQPPFLRRLPGTCKASSFPSPNLLLHFSLARPPPQTVALSGFLSTHPILPSYKACDPVFLSSEPRRERDRKKEREREMTGCGAEEAKTEEAKVFRISAFLELFSRYSRP